MVDGNFLTCMTLPRLPFSSSRPTSRAQWLACYQWATSWLVLAFLPVCKHTASAAEPGRFLLSQGTHHSRQPLIRSSQPNRRPTTFPPSTSLRDWTQNVRKQHAPPSRVETTLGLIASFVISVKPLLLITPLQLIPHPFSIFCLQLLRIPTCMPQRQIVLPTLSCLVNQTLLSLFLLFPFPLHC